MCPIDLSGHKNSQGNANGTGELVMVILENDNRSICIIVSKFNIYFWFPKSQNGIVKCIPLKIYK